MQKKILYFLFSFFIIVPNYKCHCSGAHFGGLHGGSSGSIGANSFYFSPVPMYYGSNYLNRFNHFILEKGKEFKEEKLIIHRFFFGAFPLREYKFTNKESCKEGKMGGASTVVNPLYSILTFGIYTPMTVTIKCIK